MRGKDNWKKLAEKLQAELKDDIKRIEHVAPCQATPAPDSLFKKPRYQFFKVNPYRARNLRLAQIIWGDTTDDHKEHCMRQLRQSLPETVECSRLRALEFFGWRRHPGRSKPAKRAMAKLAARRGRRG